VDAAIALFSGAKADKAREIWLVDKAPVVIEKLKSAKKDLDAFMQSQGLSGKPADVANLKGDDARAAFIKHFKEVQKLQTQLDQYTDLTNEQEQAIAQVLPKNELTAFRGAYLETAQRLRAQQNKPGDAPNPAVEGLDFEFVLFASATIDYDYIMQLIADFSQQKPGKQTMTRDELIGLIASDSKFLNEREDITEYVRSLKAGEGLDEKAIRAGYVGFKAKKDAKEIEGVAAKHGLPTPAVQAFVDRILQPPMIFDAEQLTTLLAPLDLAWKARTQKELALMDDLVPLLKKRAGDREITGLKAYEE
jgi:type I restriction enzyme R subunit